MMSDQSFTHDSVLLRESVQSVVTDPSGIYVDATFGRGGHSQAILDQLNDQGRLIAIDKDPQAVAVGQALSQADDRFEIVHGSFAELSDFLAARGIDRVTGVFADLGVSSPQLDDADRGFSFQNDGPLDMRMNSAAGVSATEWLQYATLEEMAKVFREYGEERFAKRIAGAIVEARTLAPITRTLQLAKIVSEANPAWEKHKHPATRVFQAVRIFINKELEDLEVLLADAAASLEVGGRLSVISFHSLEDRIVKRFMRDLAAGDQPPPGVPVMDKDISRPFKLSSKAIKPKAQEVEHNVRSRSAVLRSIERVAYA